MDNRVEELRRQRGLSQEAFARAIRVSRQTVSSIENGRYNPSILLAITADSLQSMYETAQAQLTQYEMGGDEDDTVQAQDADSDPAD